MRHTVRPFKVEFKSRLSRSTPMRPAKGEADDIKASTPSFLDTSDFSAARRSTANGYDAAMKAAVAVFGRSASVAPVSEPPPSAAPVGRVLPSLIENADALTTALTDADSKMRRSRGAGTAETASVLRKKTRVQSARAIQKEPVEQVTTQAPPAAAPDRERRSIHKRRLLDAELKAGEKWKRRLCRAAR